MIELKVSGCCEGCIYCEIKLECYYCGLKRSYVARCIHENVCTHLEHEKLPSEGDDHAAVL